MKADFRTLQEQLLYSLRELYQQYGYSQFKMSKFEAYDLYMQNKEFLVSDGIITFTDTDGTLMALKPDVTLSIVKNYRKTRTPLQKVCYGENVYRIAGASRSYREIMQVGLECMGDVGLYEIGEVILLAAKSLKQISDRWILDLSHADLVYVILSDMGLNDSAAASVLQCLGERNEDGIKEILSQEQADMLIELMRIHGPIGTAIAQLPAFVSEKHRCELNALAAMLHRSGLDDHIQIDFSIISNFNYYNGIIFRGYVEGLPSQVLAGGQYDRLMEKMGKDASGVGFAVYLDQLERLDERRKQYDIDTVLIYDPEEDPVAVAAAAEQLKEHGVLVLKALPKQLRYRRLLKFTDGRLEEIEVHG